jgi:hypothetical protein
MKHPRSAYGARHLRQRPASTVRFHTLRETYSVMDN